MILTKLKFYLCRTVVTGIKVLGLCAVEGIFKKSLSINDFMHLMIIIPPQSESLLIGFETD